MADKIFSGKVFLLITGASKGIGKAFAKSLGSSLENGSHVLLLARNFENLKETANCLPNHLTVSYESVDLSTTTAKKLEDTILKCLGTNGTNGFDEAVIIHNVGSVGDVSQLTVNMTDHDYWTDYFNLNVFNPAVLNGVFIELFKEINKKHVINITSLCAIQPTKSMGYYCSGKAAREMYFKVFAKENPNINVLNYSPGPVETEMFLSLVENLGDADTKGVFKNIKDTSILTTEQTTKRLVEVLLNRKYTSGDHVDYYDDV